MKVKAIHKSITLDRVTDAIERRNSPCCDNPGFCIACGEEAFECEPDAREYECEVCGEKTVYGAEEILFFI